VGYGVGYGVGGGVGALVFLYFLFILGFDVGCDVGFGVGGGVVDTVTALVDLCFFNVSALVFFVRVVSFDVGALVRFLFVSVFEGFGVLGGIATALVVVDVGDELGFELGFELSFGLTGFVGLVWSFVRFDVVSGAGLIALVLLVVFLYCFRIRRDLNSGWWTRSFRERRCPLWVITGSILVVLVTKIQRSRMVVLTMSFIMFDL
jgi:hypothetical protein